MAIHFDEWRADYNGMTYEEQVVFYNEVEKVYPDQTDFDPPSWHRFFDYVLGGIGPVSVLEIGGWKGEMAEMVFRVIPEAIKTLVVRGEIKPTWFNYEISQEAVDKCIIPDQPRYHISVPPDFAWNIPLPLADVFIGSHVIEHIKENEFVSLLYNLPSSIKYIALESPIRETDTNRDWARYTGTHILEIGWQELESHLAGHGFFEVERLRGYNEVEASQFRAYRFEYR